MQKILLTEIYGNLTSTLIALFVIMLVYGFVDFFIVRKIESNRQKKQFRIRAFYIACIVFIFLLARIWVEGFTHLLAVLGLVSAALVVTNKETIMNFVGWLIITWRELFSEEDLIQIQQYKGYVCSMGVLYFTLSEVSENANGYVTGKIIRVPNGLVANNALTNFSQTSHLLEQKFSIAITSDSDLNYSMAFFTGLVNKKLSSFYKGKKEFNEAYISRKNKFLFNRIHLKAKAIIQPKFEKLSVVDLTLRYYCFTRDAQAIQQLIWLEILDTVPKEEKIKLVTT